MDRLVFKENGLYGFKGTANQVMEKLYAYEEKQSNRLLHEAKIQDGTKIYVPIYDSDENDYCVLEDSYLYNVTEYFHGELNSSFFLTEAEAKDRIKKWKQTSPHFRYVR